MLTVPKDVLNYMAQWLSFRDVLRLRQVCSLLHSLTFQSHPALVKMSQRYVEPLYPSRVLFDEFRKWCVGCIEYMPWPRNTYMHYTTDEPGYLCVRCFRQYRPFDFIDVTDHVKTQMTHLFGYRPSSAVHKLFLIDRLNDEFSATTATAERILDHLIATDWHVMDDLDWHHAIHMWVVDGLPVKRQKVK
jgi:hypothetical protein